MARLTLKNVEITAAIFVAAIFLCSCCTADAEGRVQVGNRFPLGVGLGENVTCESAEDDGFLRYWNGSVQLCKDGDWELLNADEVQQLNERTAELLNRINALETSNCTVTYDMQRNNELTETLLQSQHRHMCNMHGWYNPTTAVCDCDCDSTRGCWDSRWACSRCDAARGWTGDLCDDDIVGPTITLHGASSLTLEAGTPYTESGYTATDNGDGDVTADVLVTGDVPVPQNVVGVYAIAYDVVDSSGNAAATVYRTVEVVDTTAPAITLNGDATITEAITEGYEYSDLGVADITEVSSTGYTSLSPESTIPTPPIPGTFTYTHRASDASGNVGVAVRTVVLVDLLPPVIDTMGGNVSVEAGEDWVVPGYTCSDNVQWPSSLTVIVNSSNVPAAPHSPGDLGSHAVSLQCDDFAGNSVVEVIYVEIVDTTSPSLTLQGDDPLYIEVGGVFSDPGALAADNVAWPSLGTVLASETVDTSYEHVEIITYSYADGAGHTVSVNRTVDIWLPGPPDGLHLQRAGNSCLSLLDGETHQNVSGVYWITFYDSAPPTRVFCDMENALGGWTLVYSVQRSQEGFPTSSARGELDLSDTSFQTGVGHKKHDDTWINAIFSHAADHHMLIKSKFDIGNNYNDPAAGGGPAYVAPTDVTYDSVFSFSTQKVWNTDASALPEIIVGADISHASWWKVATEGTCQGTTMDNTDVKIQSARLLSIGGSSCESGYQISDACGVEGNNEFGPGQYTGSYVRNTRWNCYHNNVKFFVREDFPVSASLGQSPTSAGDSCLAIRNMGQTASGVYWVDFYDTVAPMQVYCDMDSAGGGWTLVYSVQRSKEAFPTAAARGTLDLTDNTFTTGVGHKKYSDSMINTIFSRNSLHHMMIKSRMDVGDGYNDPAQGGGTAYVAPTVVDYDSVFAFTTSKVWNSEASSLPSIIVGADTSNHNWVKESTVGNCQGTAVSNTDVKIQNARLLSLGASCSSAFQISDACGSEGSGEFGAGQYTGSYILHRSWNCYHNSVKFFVREDF